MSKEVKSWLTFEILPKSGKTDRYQVRSGDLKLGVVKWFSGWRRYAFYPCSDTLFDANCLTEVVSFIKNLMDERRGKAN